MWWRCAYSMTSVLICDPCPSYKSSTGLFGGIWPTKNLNHLKNTVLLICLSVVPVNNVLAGAPLMRSRDILSRGKIIMGGSACPDADPHARMVFVLPFSAAVIDHTAFWPRLAQTFDGLCTRHTCLICIIDLRGR